MLKDTRVQCWIENYRNLLDAWRFWHKRAEFDIHRGKLDPSSKPLAQVTPLILNRNKAKWINIVFESLFKLEINLNVFFLLKLHPPPKKWK